jgi:hypothetical protein
LLKAASAQRSKDVDARDKRGHDEEKIKPLAQPVIRQATSGRTR